jgi:hypothetical protein
MDALVFMAGLVAGVWVFAEAYVALAGFMEWGDLGAVTFADVLGIPFWALAAAVVGIALAAFWLIGRLERARGGPSR